jgi:hypothetical protein
MKTSSLAIRTSVHRRTQKPSKVEANATCPSTKYQEPCARSHSVESGKGSQEGKPIRNKVAGEDEREEEIYEDEDDFRRELPWDGDVPWDEP